MTIQEAHEKIDRNEFEHWLAFDRLSPIGDERVDVLFSMLTSTIANVNRGKKTKAFKLKDFIPKWNTPKSVQTPEQMQSILKSFSSKVNHGIDRRANSRSKS